MPNASDHDRVNETPSEGRPPGAAFAQINETFLQAAHTQMDRNLRLLGDADEIARRNGETAMAMTRTAAKSLAVFTEAATRMSQRAITAGLELSQATMNAQAVRAPVQTEQGNAPFLFANVNDQMARFSQAWVQAARGMMAPMTQAPPAAEAAADGHSRS